MTCGAAKCLVRKASASHRRCWTVIGPVGRWRRLCALPAPASSRDSQPQRQLPIRPDVGINEVFQLARYRAALKTEAAQQLRRHRVPVATAMIASAKAGAAAAVT